jgi:hypothetical protein
LERVKNVAEERAYQLLLFCVVFVVVVVISFFL